MGEKTGMMGEGKEKGQKLRLDGGDGDEMMNGGILDIVFFCRFVH